MTVTEFVNKYNGQTKGYPDDNSYKGECLSIVKLYLKEAYGFNPPPSGSNSAYGYWSNFPSPLSKYFEKVYNQPKLIPKRGDIIIWNTNVGNGYGHIAIFLDGNTTSFTSFDQNWNGQHAHQVEHNYNNVVGWLTPRKEIEMPDDTIVVQKSDWEKVLKNSLTLDSVTDMLKLERNSNSDTVKGAIQKHIDAENSYKLERNNLRFEVEQLNDEINKLAKDLKDCQQNGGGDKDGDSAEISPQVAVAGYDWEINGVEVDDKGRVTANYRRIK